MKPTAVAVRDSVTLDGSGLWTQADRQSTLNGAPSSESNSTAVEIIFLIAIDISFG